VSTASHRVLEGEGIAAASGLRRAEIIGDEQR
jgi:hypothetical protein